MKKALIISGGEFSPVQNLVYDFVIACDKGAEYAKKMNIVPNVIIGDFDSYKGSVEKDFPDSEILTYPIVKDDTDTMLAIKLALQKGYRHIIMINALGNRLDHAMANIQSLHYISSFGGIGEIISEREHLRTLNSQERELTLKKSTDYFSLFALTDKVYGLTIKGATYNVDRIVLNNNFPLGLGNSFSNDTATISIESGVLLIIQSKSN